jgi:hypothetical protein
MKPRDTWALLLLSALWGGSFLCMRVAAPMLGPVVLIEGRVLLAGVILMVYVALRKGSLALRAYWRPSRREWQYPQYTAISDLAERRLAVIRLHAQGWSVTSISTYLQLCRHFPHTRSFLQGIEFSHEVRNRCIQVPVVDRSEESSKERNSPSFNSHQKGELCLLARYRCEDMIVKNGEPQQRAHPLPMVKRAKFLHLEPCGQAIAQVQHPLRLGDHFSRWSQFHGFDMFGPAWPCFDTSEVMPGGFKRDINHKSTIDQRWHSLFPLLSAFQSANWLPLLS